MIYAYVAVILITAVTWIAAFVCATVAVLEKEAPQVIAVWAVLAVVAAVATRVAGSLLKQKMNQHDETEKENTGTH